MTKLTKKKPAKPPREVWVAIADDGAILDIYATRLQAIADDCWSHPPRIVKYVRADGKE
jgi:hypothetical protein